MEKVSVYVPCYNAGAYLARVFEGVLAQTLRPDEILIVDDGSRDDSLEIAARYPVTIVRHERNRGLAAARNTAFCSARNDLVAALDADCVAQPTWLEKLVARISRENLAGVGGRLVESVQDSLADRWRAQHMPQHWGDGPLVNPRFLFGNNTLHRKSAVEQAGGYDERMRTNGEDSDMSARLRARGFSIAYEPAAVVNHLRSDTLLSILDTYWRWWKSAPAAYANGISIEAVLKNLYRVHFRQYFIPTVKADLRRKNFELLGLDSLMFFYLPYRDFRLLLEEARAARPPRRAAEA